MEQQRVFIADFSRTPIGCPNKSLQRFMSSDLAAKVIQTILKKNHLDPIAIDQVVFGQSLPSTMPNNIGHYAWLKAELPVEVPGYTVQSNSGSALQAVRNAYYLIGTGNDQIVMAGGADSYSSAPFVMRDVRLSFLPQNRMVIDSLDEADCCTQPQAMSSMERHQMAFGTESTAEAKAYAEQSRRKAQGYHDVLSTATVPMTYVDRKKGEIMISEDEWLGKINESPLAPKADAAAVALLVNEQQAKSHNLPLQAEVLGFAVGGCEPTHPNNAGVTAVKKLLAAKALSIDDISAFEVIENSAEEVLDLANALSIDVDKVNPFGGALAFGKCDGAEGILMLQRLCGGLKQGQIGIAVTYSAGGMGMACLIRKV